MVVGEFAEKRDLIIIGGGPGGYQAAIRAAQLGKSVTLIEKGLLGGVCLNRGCIPSKVFTHAAKKMDSLSVMDNMGIKTTDPMIDFVQLRNYKNQVVDRLRSGVEGLMEANKIEVICGEANFTAENKIGVANGHQFDVYEFSQAIVATGSMPDWDDRDHERVLLPETVYQIDEIPESLVVYGSDYIALEVAFSFNKLGCNVKLYHHDTEFPFNETINRELSRILKKTKIKVNSGHKLDFVEPASNEVEIQFSKEDKVEKETASHIYISTKQKPNINNMGVERIGITLKENGFIKTDYTTQTTLANVFAVGDVSGGPFSAVKAIKEGKVAAETIAGMKSEVDLTLTPTVVHSIPPIAAVGLTELEARNAGHSVITSNFSISGNSYAMISGEKEGIVTIVKDAETDLLLGIHMIGSGAVELISTGVTALEMVAREEDLKFPSYPHPSINEGLLEAIEGLTDMAIHVPPKNKKHL
ncbi:dihydrolipoyl dehydrogenase family protein [Virgibacillus salinus]|uniref:Dihydrolipoyl dehydrogenase n=1 Tax=Virgibacillus salinus TaxID=553311 RepID=A0A1H0Z481_9BACI|nr:FAD-dependent oxidoreductase [Virgibacillus salinus]SDQ22302.1 dihydrolipoamide dehydrogenase [Virgibacillus salinus]